MHCTQSSRGQANETDRGHRSSHPGGRWSLRPRAGRAGCPAEPDHPSPCCRANGAGAPEPKRPGRLPLALRCPGLQTLSEPVGNPFALAMLALEAQKVVELRLVKLAGGGCDACDEAHLKASEKMSAAVEAAGTLMMGGSFEAVIARYREHVAANTERLLA